MLHGAGIFTNICPKKISQFWCGKPAQKGTMAPCFALPSETMPLPALGRLSIHALPECSSLAVKNTARSRGAGGWRWAIGGRRDNWIGIHGLSWIVLDYHRLLRIIAKYSW